MHVLVREHALACSRFRYYANRIGQAPASHTLNSCNCSRRHLLAMHLRAIHEIFSKLLDCNFSLIMFLNSILAYDQAHAIEMISNLICQQKQYL